jgi:hypothetical protein
MRRFTLLFVMGLAALFARAQEPRKPPVVAEQAPTAGIDAVMAYAGTWKVQGERFATAYSDAGKEESTLRNDCWKSGGFVACNQYVNGESKVLLVFTYNAQQKVYTSYPVPQNGDPVNAGRLQIIGNVWTFPWQVSQGVNITYFHVVNVFTSSDRIEYAQEFSTDNVHWTPMAKGFETRTGN